MEDEGWCGWKMRGVWVEDEGVWVEDEGWCGWKMRGGVGGR